MASETHALDRAVTGLPDPVDDVEAGLANLAEHGVTIHRNYLAEPTRLALLDRLNEQADMERLLGLATLGGAGGPQDLLESRPGDTETPMFQLVEFLANKGRIFIDLIMSPTAQAYAKGVFQGWPHKVWATGGIISRRGLAKQKAHIDQVGVPPAMCGMPAMINIFICVSDFDEDMGATLISPGTHTGPRPIWGVNEDSAPFFPAVAKAGDAIIWDGRTWHRGGPHTSDKARYAISTGFGLAAVTPQDVYTSALHDRVHATLNDEELAMLGFRVETGGYAGRLAPRTPFDTRTNCNRVTPYVPELHRPD
jgi:hypothetical protein